MKASALLALSLLRIYFRDRLTVVMSLALMVFMMTLFGLAMGDDQFNVALPVATVAPQPGAQAQAILTRLAADDLLKPMAVAGEAEMLEQIRLGHVIAGLTLSSRDGAPAVVVTVGQQSNKWQRIGLERLDRIVAGDATTPIARPYVLDQRPITAPRNRYIDFIFPGMLAMAIMQTCLSSGVVVLHAMKTGVLRRLRITPLSGFQLLGGFIAGRLVVVALHLLALALVAIWGFGANVLAPAIQLAAMAGLGCLAFLALGLSLAVCAPSLESGSLIIQLISFPMTFVCGIFFKVSALPAYLSWLPKVMPLTYLVDALRGMINAGLPLASFSSNAIVLGGWFLASLCLGLFGLQRIQSQES